jgi:hypothetical protein
MISILQNSTWEQGAGGGQGLRAPGFHIGPLVLVPGVPGSVGKQASFNEREKERNIQLMHRQNIKVKNASGKKNIDRQNIKRKNAVWDKRLNGKIAD